ncbi:myeloid leukemia factor 1-like [Mizuhopecten yessoensis]|uniref:Myeloid leukemia factor 1 n=1 Tax=Mizuhopecten yessoensis TaxID=6573 RepID=A0A210QG74_MIZYE|nr:myeloid leukemia factor 1-like [Mizuhopecten yessoensis]OWF47744.1 Myeloid leukemia factor 1 [Mizuhopecten yessoensis]
MLGGSMFRSMEEDPFFAGHREHMRRMDSLFADPFGMMQPHIQAPRQLQLEAPRAHARVGNAMVPQGFMDPMDMFGSFDSMFSNMRKNMQRMGQQFSIQNTLQPDPNAHSFSQTSFMSYSNMPGQGQPKVYQSSSSTRVAPGGVRETQRTLRDSESGVEKMSIGHHINERAHVVEQSRNHRTGQQDHNEDLINLDEDDKQAFNAEWQGKMKKQRHDRNRLDYARRGERSHEHRQERSERHGSGRQLAIESPRDHAQKDIRRHEHTHRYRERE